MTFSYNKTVTLRPQKEKRLFTFLVALGTAACFFVPYMILGEGYFTFYGDFNVQQIPFYQMCHQAIREGNIGWNWLTDLGANFVGSYTFYLLGSPFFWITLLFPNSFVPYLMGPLLILKFACAALTAYLYIRRFTRTPMAAVLGGLLYAFSGFSVYNIFFNHFHEAIIVFPLLLLSMELLITENRRGIFAVTVTLCAITNYFFFFGMVVFCVIYYLVRIFSHAINFKFSRFAALVFEALIGVALAAAVLVPSIAAIISNSRISNLLLGWSGITYGKEQIYLNIIQCFFFPPDLPARPVFFPGAEVKWSSLGGWMPVFSMVGVFVWFSHRKGSWHKRVIAICVFMAMVPILNSAFYAFNASYYARWFYMPILMMALATAMLTEDASVDWSSGFKWVTGITAAFVAVIGFFPQKNKEGEIVFGLYTPSKDGTYAVRFLITSIIAIASLFILKALLGIIKTNREKFYRTAVMCVCLVSVLYANVFVALGRTHSYEVKEVMIDQLIEGEVFIDDTTNYRIDVYDGLDNTGMYLGYPSINAFHSVVPSSIMEFYKYIGVERSVGSRPDTDVPAIRPLLSVKYLINRTGGDGFVNEQGKTLMPDYEYVKTSGGYYVYENTNYIPYGFSYDYYMDYDFCDSYNEDLRSRLMLKALLLTDEQVKKYGEYMTNLSTLETAGDYVDNSGVSLILSNSAMAEDASRLAKTSAYSFEIDNGGFTARVHRDKKSLVFFSVPYDKGWTATVNGKETEIERVNVGFMAVAVDAGDSTVRFNYKTPGLTLGIQITLGSLLVFIVYFVISNIYIKNHPNSISYPEGDLLLQRWHSDEIAEAIAEHQVLSSNTRKSILDDIDDDPIPKTENHDGFNIDTSAFDDE